MNVTNSLQDRRPEHDALLLNKKWRRNTSLPPHTPQSVFPKHSQLATRSRILQGDQPLMAPATREFVSTASGPRYPHFFSSSWTDCHGVAVLGSSANLWENFSKCVFCKKKKNPDNNPADFNEIRANVHCKKRRSEDLKITLNPRNN